MARKMIDPLLEYRISLSVVEAGQCVTWNSLIYTLATISKVI
jgi:hypothetical protein